MQSDDENDTKDTADDEDERCVCVCVYEHDPVFIPAW